MKIDTKDVIKNLNENNFNCKMITGDNILTGIETAFQANILDR